MTSKKAIYLFRVGLAIFIVLFISCGVKPKHDTNVLPTFMIGTFEDDYGIHYQVDNSMFQLLPDDKYHVLSVNIVERYIILQNDSLNTFAPSLFTRIDYEKLSSMEPFEWAFCFSSFEEASVEEAINKVNTQKTDLMKGCNGFPFSRMKPSGRTQK
ncbi:MAG: hypothetical protein AAGA77_18840 [Bacteroidota bacterium]